MTTRFFSSLLTFAFAFAVLLAGPFAVSAQAQSLEQINIGGDQRCSNGSCEVGSGEFPFRFECDGRVADCRQNESYSSSVGGASCGKSVQIDVFNKDCRPTKNAGDPWLCGGTETGGPLDGNIQRYATWYTGDCPGGTTPPTGGPQCLSASAFVGDPNKETNVENEARAPGLGEEVYLVCKKVPNGSRYKFRIIYTRTQPVYSNLANSGVQKLKALTNTGKKRNRSVAFKVPSVGFYYGQCQTCVPSGSGERCSAWEPTTVAGNRLTNTAGSPTSAGAELRNSIEENEDVTQLTNDREGTQSVDDDELGDPGTAIELPFYNNEDLDESDTMAIPTSELSAQDE